MTATAFPHSTQAGARLAFLPLVLAVSVGIGNSAEMAITELHYHPASGKPAEEFLELHNVSANPVNLSGWRLVRGVQFTFPAVVVPSGGFLVVAADTNAFAASHAGLEVPVVGNWTGSLSDRGESVELRNAAGATVERLNYATQGDWGERAFTAAHQGFRGLEWLSGHDGRGRTLERINPFADGSLGQNWKSSATPGGTPGRTNSVHTLTQAPFITDVRHSPLVPRSAEAVTVLARVRGGDAGPRSVAVHYRRDGAAEFLTEPMVDDGLHGDDFANDGLYAVRLPEQPAGTVVEFYVRVTTPGGPVRTWPPPLADGSGQLANALYQVDESDDGQLPRFRVIFTARDRLMLTAIEGQLWHSTSDAQINASVVTTENGVSEFRHNVGFRIRGSTSRDVDPPSRRIAFPDDRVWHRQRVVVLNAVNPHSQVAGSALAQLSGLPAGRSRLAELRENGLARSGAGTPVAGLYAQNESLNGDYTDQAFPDDGNGNLYSVQGFGNMDYLGESPSDYAHPHYYAKETNAELDDWSDLIQFTRTLNQTPAADLGAVLPTILDVPEWVRYFAANTLLANNESTLSNPRITRPTPTNTVVVTGDYFLYRGLRDPRFRLVPYDLDSALGMDGTNTAHLGLYSFLGVPALGRVFGEPTVASLYHAELRRLADTVFLPAHVNELLDRLLAPHLPAATVQAMKDFNVRRRDIVLVNLPTATRVTTVFPAVGGYPTTTNASVLLAGTSAAAHVTALRIAGAPAVWDAAQGKWSATVPLLPGLNRLVIESLDAAGAVLHRQPYDLWREAGETVVTSPLAANAAWRAEDGPFRINERLVIPAGVTLTIGAGTSVQFGPGASLLVQGRLLVEGTADRRVQFLVHPRLGGRWNGIGFDGATNECRLVQADLRAVQRGTIQTTNSTILLDHVEWPGHQANALISRNSSLTVRHCVFPNMLFDEAVQANQLPANGHALFEGNTFGSTVGYADIVDFYGGQRPGPIPVFLNNVFLGGSDDGLDLDGTDAHIEGNVFMHFHKNHSDTSESSAIATGRGSNGETSRLTVVRNVFFDNDHDLTLKDYAVADVRHNTFVGSTRGSLAFSEPLRPGGAPPISMRARDCIWWNTPTVFFGLDQTLFTNAWFDVRVDDSVFSEPGPWMGTNNLAADPLFVNPTNDFRLRSPSPARGRALHDLDLGAHVPAGAVIVGAPSGKSAVRELRLTIAGAGLTLYRFSLDGASWSEPRPLTEPLLLSSLPLGVRRLRVVGLNSGNVWQPEPGTVVEWDVVADFADVRLNELLAENTEVTTSGKKSPDLLELYNPGSLPFDLSGMSLTDNPERPRKFVFPEGTTIAAAEYLVLKADSSKSPGEFHLGFSFDNDGEQLLLFDRHGILKERLDFGGQLPGYSIGRDSTGAWHLCLPTLGSRNTQAQLGDPRLVRLNEWSIHTDPNSNSTDELFSTVELFNLGAAPVDLTGLYFTDTLASAPRQAPIHPLTFISGRGFRVLQVSASARPEAGVDLSLSSEYGLLSLTATDGTAVDAVIYTAIPQRQSEGRRPDGFGPISLLPSQSLHVSNGHPPIALKVSRDATGTAVIADVSGTFTGRNYLLEFSSVVEFGWTRIDSLEATGPSGRFAPIPLDGSHRFFRVTVAE